MAPPPIVSRSNKPLVSNGTLSVSPPASAASTPTNALASITPSTGPSTVTVQQYAGPRIVTGSALVQSLPTLVTSVTTILSPTNSNPAVTQSAPIPSASPKSAMTPAAAASTSPSNNDDDSPSATPTTTSGSTAEPNSWWNLNPMQAKSPTNAVSTSTEGPLVQSAASPTRSGSFSLRIFVMRARDLPRNSTTASVNSSYVTVTLTHQRSNLHSEQTPHKENTRNPIFKTAFLFQNLPAPTLLQAPTKQFNTQTQLQLEFCVVCDNRPVGSVVIPQDVIHRLYAEQTAVHSKFYPLTSGGVLHIILTACETAELYSLSENMLDPSLQSLLPDRGTAHDKEQNRNVTIAKDKRLSTAELDKRRTHRCKILNEIQSTEASYVQSLQRIVECYVQPLRQAVAVKQLGSSVDQSTIQSLVNNIEVLAHFHSMFLKDLSQAVERQVSGSSTAPTKSPSPTSASASSATTDEPSTVSQVFTKYGDYFKLYTAYLNHYETCITTLSTLQRNNSKFQQFLDKTVTPKLKEHGSLDLLSYLIMPVQRIPRYVLLLKELMKFTSVLTDEEIVTSQQPTAAHHATRSSMSFTQAIAALVMGNSSSVPVAPPSVPLPSLLGTNSVTEWDSLWNALEKISQIALLINEQKRSIENMQKLFTIQSALQGNCPADLIILEPHRRLIRETQLNVVKQASMLQLGTLRIKRRIAYLFNDLLLYCTTDGSQYKEHINLVTINKVENLNQGAMPVTSPTAAASQSSPTSSPTQPPNSTSTSLEIVTNKTKMTMQFDTVEELQLWQETIDEQMRHLQNQRSIQRKRRVENARAKGDTLTPSAHQVVSEQSNQAAAAEGDNVHVNIMSGLKNLSMQHRNGTMKDLLANMGKEMQDGEASGSTAAAAPSSPPAIPNRPRPGFMLQRDASALSLVNRAGTFNKKQAEFLTDLNAKKQEAANSINGSVNHNPHSEGSGSVNTFKVRQVQRRGKLQQDTFSPTGEEESAAG